MKVAYADPPYIGQSNKHYKDHEDYAGEVDHGQLIDRLEDEYTDGWALSLHMPSLGTILRLCEERGLSQMAGDFRVLAWIKTFGAYKRNVRVAYVWEPVIVRPPARLEGAVPTRDFGGFDEILAEPIAMKKGLSGAKPERFAFWLFNCLGLRPVDEFDDLFPGTKGMSESWQKWCDLGGPKLKQSVKVTNTFEGVYDPLASQIKKAA